MIVYSVTVHVKESNIEDFIEATKANHLGTRTEEGNLRFDVLQSADEPGRFLLYEVYKSTEAVAEHKKTEHYLKWRETVADWMAKPREGLCHNVICPSEKDKW